MMQCKISFLIFCQPQGPKKINPSTKKMSKVIKVIKSTLPKVAKTADLASGKNKDDAMNVSESSISPKLRQAAQTIEYDYYGYYDYPTNQDIKLQQQQAAALHNNAFAKRQSLAGAFASSSDHYGSYSSKHDDCDNGISLGLLTTALLGIGVMFFTLFTKITKGRRKRSLGEDALSGIYDTASMTWDQFQELAFGGNTENHT